MFINEIQKVHLNMLGCSKMCQSMIGSPGMGGLHYGVKWGCAPILGSFWPENSGIGIFFYWKISVIGVFFPSFTRNFLGLRFTFIIKILVMGPE